LGVLEKCLPILKSNKMLDSMLRSKLLERIVKKDSIVFMSAHIGHKAITEIPRRPRIENRKFVG